jgi:hypothetical protein
LLNAAEDVFGVRVLEDEEISRDGVKYFFA